MPALLITLVIVAMLGLISATIPIEGRGDFGQWLMTSRYYLGQGVPDYRTISSLPPLVPLMIAGLHLFIGDPVLLLQTVNFLALLGIGLSFFVIGKVLLRGAFGGLMTAIVALLVTDRYLELLSFGGLLQAASIVFVNFAVAALAHAADHPARAKRAWTAASVCLVLAALSHVGTALVAVPTGLVLAGLVVFRQRPIAFGHAARATWPLLIGVAAIATYWFVLILPASQEYVSNPASLAYRGPGKLFVGLFAYWPTIVVLIAGAAAMVLGTLRELVYRAPGRYLFLAVWTALVWATLTFAVITDASTDYPRFSTLLLAPAAVAAAAALTWLAHSLSDYVQDLLSAPPSSTAVLAIAALFVASVTPFAVLRYQTVMGFYPPSDAAALTAAVRYADELLGGRERGTVLAAVREGKWLEGLTGREALFSQPVRFAFRRVEWQRSVDADALLKSSAAIVNQYFFVKYTGFSNLGGIRAPRDLLISANHLGEFVDVLQIQSANTQILGPDQSGITAESGPGQLSSHHAGTEATLTTVWEHTAGAEPVEYAQSLTLVDGGTTLTIRGGASGAELRTELRPAHGTSFESVEFIGRDVRVCVAPIADVPPCLRISPVESDVALGVSEDGISVESGPTFTLFVTALTPGGASVGMRVLSPKQLADSYGIGAAILDSTEADYAFRRERLEAVGMRVATMLGPYAVLAARQ